MLCARCASRTTDYPLQTTNSRRRAATAAATTAVRRRVHHARPLPPPFATAANIESVRAPPPWPFGQVPASSLRPIGRSSSYFDGALRTVVLVQRHQPASSLRDIVPRARFLYLQKVLE